MPVVRVVAPVVRVDKRDGLSEQIVDLSVPVKTFPFHGIALIALSITLSVLPNSCSKDTDKIFSIQEKINKKYFIYICALAF